MTRTTDRTNGGKRLLATVSVLTAALATATGAPAQGRADLVLAALDRDTPHVPGQLIVQFQAGVDAPAVGKALGRVGAQRKERLVEGHWRHDRKGDLELVTLPPGLAIAAAVRNLAQDPAVEFAEPNWIVEHMAKPVREPSASSEPASGSEANDPYYTLGNLWGMYGDATAPANAHGSQAGEAWATRNDCSAVYVGIIDEGYMYAHEDLAANAGTNPGEIAGNGIDDDSNGLVDDAYGWDFVGNDDTVFDGTGDDHGTHVAGTIGAVGNNGKGVAGVCWRVRLLSAKFLGSTGGTIANAVKAVDYFTDLKLRHGINLVATNNSWGGGGYSQALADAIERANDANILFIAAAGNGGADGWGDDNDAIPHYPSSYAHDNVIAVAALTSSGARASYSNYGASSVDLGAPGSAVWSTVPTTGDRGKRTTITSGYASYNGTSMATPHVTGAAALYAAATGTTSASAIKQAILANVIATPSLAGATTSGGRLNVSGLFTSGQ